MFFFTFFLPFDDTSIKSGYFFFYYFTSPGIIEYVVESYRILSTIVL